MLRWVGHLKVWAMLEVVMLGILVALAKIAQLASVDPGIGMYAFGATILLIPAIMTSFDKRELWRASRMDGPGMQGRAGAAAPGARMTVPLPREAGTRRVRSHASWSRVPPAPMRPAFAAVAARNSKSRRRGSIETTWALLIAASICYIPANLLPVLDTTTPQGSDADTIMGGVIFLYTSGSWPLALVVLIASVMIPLGKLISLAYLLISVQRGSRQEQARAHAAVSNRRIHRPLVDARCVRRHLHRRSRAAAAADVGDTRSRRAVLCRRRGAYHARGRVVRSAPDLGFRRVPSEPAHG